MSQCKTCSKCVACDWIEPPQNCADYKVRVTNPIELDIYNFIDHLSEVSLRGGRKITGWCRGLEGDYLMLHVPKSHTHALDINQGLVLRSLENCFWESDTN